MKTRIAMIIFAICLSSYVNAAETKETNIVLSELAKSDYNTSLWEINPELNEALSDFKTLVNKLEQEAHREIDEGMNKKILTAKKEKFYILDQIGQGGEAHVFRVRGRNGDAVARILFKNGNTEEITQERLILIHLGLFIGSASINYNVPDFPKADFREVILMPYFPGITLSKVPKSTPLLVRAMIGCYFNKAVEFLVSYYNIYHRDLTPNNAIVDEDGNVRLIDFGVACFCKDANQGDFGVTLWQAPEAPQACDDLSTHYCAGKVMASLLSKVNLDIAFIDHEQKFPCEHGCAISCNNCIEDCYRNSCSDVFDIINNMQDYHYFVVEVVFYIINITEHERAKRYDNGKRSDVLNALYETARALRKSFELCSEEQKPLFTRSMPESNVKSSSRSKYAHCDSASFPSGKSYSPTKRLRNFFSATF